MQPSKWWLDLSKQIWCSAVEPLKIKKKRFIRVITSSWYWGPKACWNCWSSSNPQGPKSIPAWWCSSWACRCCTGYPRFKFSHWPWPSLPSPLWQCTRMVTMARAQHNASLFLMVMTHLFFLFSLSRHRRPGLYLLPRPEPGPGMDTPHPLGNHIRGWRTHCCLTCLPTWPTSHPIEQSIARTHPWRNYLFGRHAWNHERWERNWQNDEQVAAVDVLQPRWHYARFQSRLAQYYPHPQDSSIRAAEHWITPAPRHCASGIFSQ